MALPAYAVVLRCLVLCFRVALPAYWRLDARAMECPVLTYHHPHAQPGASSLHTACSGTICLRACYRMTGTDSVSSGMVPPGWCGHRQLPLCSQRVPALLSCYALATRCPALRFTRISPVLLRACYAISGAKTHQSLSYCAEPY
eukprot:406914-Rhodomonas_salina.4